MPITLEALKHGLVVHDDSVLKRGSHKPDSREFCALEFSSIMRKKDFSDSPGDMPDLRPLNDAPLSSDAIRTEHLLPVMAALWDWRDWSNNKKRESSPGWKKSIRNYTWSWIECSLTIPSRSNSRDTCSPRSMPAKPASSVRRISCNGRCVAPGARSAKRRRCLCS